MLFWPTCGPTLTSNWSTGCWHRHATASGGDGYWLDVVHYGESHGYDKDKPRPNAWPYRDYVIDSLNADKPYSRFVLEQLAGDVLFPDEPQAKDRHRFSWPPAPGILSATWSCARERPTRRSPARNDRDDMVMTTMSTFTSMTVHCARCHDHKFDPIAQQDYYRLQAVFAGVDRSDQTYFDAGVKRERDEVNAQVAASEAEQKKLADERGALTSPELATLDARTKALTDELATIPDPFAPSDQAASSPTNGYHSEIASKDNETKWVQVDLGQPVTIDLVRLVPRDQPIFAIHRASAFPRDSAWLFPAIQRLPRRTSLPTTRARISRTHASILSPWRRRE